MFVTQRQIAETILGLEQVARDLKGAVEVEPIEGTLGKVVPASKDGLLAHSEFLERVARELLLLIDGDVPVEVPKD